MEEQWRDAVAIVVKRDTTVRRVKQDAILLGLWYRLYRMGKLSANQMLRYLVSRKA